MWRSASGVEYLFELPCKVPDRPSAKGERNKEDCKNCHEPDYKNRVRGESKNIDVWRHFGFGKNTLKTNKVGINMRQKIMIMFAKSQSP